MGATAYGPGWSSDAALNEYEAAHDWARTRIPTVTDVVLIGQSMGATAALIGRDQDVYDDVRAFVGISAVCDLEFMFDNSHTASIKAAFGFTLDGDYATATAGRDPLRDLAGASFDGLFMRFYASDSDTSTPKADHADALAAVASAHAAECVVVEATGAHISADHYRPTDVVSFVNRAIA